MKFFQLIIFFAEKLHQTFRPEAEAEVGLGDVLGLGIVLMECQQGYCRSQWDRTTPTLALR